MITYLRYTDSATGLKREIRTEDAPLLPVGLRVTVPDERDFRVISTDTEVLTSGAFVQWVQLGNSVSVPGKLL